LTVKSSLANIRYRKKTAIQMSFYFRVYKFKHQYIIEIDDDKDKKKSSQLAEMIRLAKTN